MDIMHAWLLAFMLLSGAAIFRMKLLVNVVSEHNIVKF